jgi:outer membrane protein TolC
MKVFSPLLWFLVSLLAAFPVLAALPEDPNSLAALLEEAAQHNPSLQAALEQVAVSHARIDQVSALPDPQLSVSLSNYPIDSFRTDASPMTGNDFKLSQSFPFPGKLSTKKEFAHQQELWAKAKYADLLLQVRQQIRDNWYQLGFQRQAISLTRSHLGLMDDLSRLVETRYQVGKGMQQNVLKAQVERSRLFDLLLRLQKDAEISQAQINRLVGRATDQSLEDVPEPVDLIYAPSLAELQQQARENRPMFGAFDALIGQSEQKVRLAALDFRPDFNIWASYRFRDERLPDGGTDFFSAGISLNLPFQIARRKAAVIEADAGSRMAHQQRQDFSRQVDFELHRSLTELTQAQTLSRLYADGIIPQAEQAYKATMAAYQVDKVDFLVLADSLMTLYNLRIELARTLAEAQRNAARLKATTGLDPIEPTPPTLSKKEDPHA